MSGLPYDLVLASADFPDWSGSPTRTLLVCTQQRSGSTLLGEAIYFAGGLGCPVEYFHAGFRPLFQTRWAAADIREYVAATHRFRTDESGIFSAKLFWWDVVELVRELVPGEFDLLARSSAAQTDDSLYRRVFGTLAHIFPRPTFIFLTRQDEIRQAISLAVAAHTGAWRRLSDRRGSASQTAPVCDFDQIVHELAGIQNDNAHWMNFFRANALPHDRMRYEDLATDYDGSLRALFDAIGRPDAPIVAPRLRKQADARSEALYREFLTEFQRRARGPAIEPAAPA